MTMTSSVEAAATDLVEGRSAVLARRASRARLARHLRSANGYRVDGPYGRIGVLRAVVATDIDGSPDHLEVSRGLFIASTACIPFDDVSSVDPARRRVVVRAETTPPPDADHRGAGSV